MDNKKYKDLLNDSDYEYTLVLSSDYMKEHEARLAQAKANERANNQPSGAQPVSDSQRLAGAVSDYEAHHSAGNAPAFGYGAQKPAGTSPAPVSSYGAQRPAGNASAPASAPSHAKQQEEAKESKPVDPKAEMDRLYGEYEKMCMKEPTVLDLDDMYPHSYQWRSADRYDPAKKEVLEESLKTGHKIADTAAYQRYVEAGKSRKFVPDSWE